MECSNEKGQRDMQ